MVRIVATVLCLIAVLGQSDVAIGTVITGEQEFVCPDNALCFPEETEFFRKDNLNSMLTRLGYTGNEKLLCGDSVAVGTNRHLVCAQQSVRGIPTYGFFLKVVFWSSMSDIRGIWCNCVREDVTLPARKVSYDQFVAAVTRFVRGHLLARLGSDLVIGQPDVALLRNRSIVAGFQLALKTNVTFVTPEGIPADFAIYVDVGEGRVIKADDLEKAVDRKGFLMDPWDDLGRRLAASPKDITLFREYQEYGAFRSRGANEAEFQNKHRDSLGRYDPQGESTFEVTFAGPLSVDQLLGLFSDYDLFTHELYYVIERKGRISNRSIEDLETASGNMEEIIETRLLDQLGSSYDWHLPALSGVLSTDLSSRSLQDVRFRSANIQMNHTEAHRFWRNERDQLIALTPSRPLNSRSPPRMHELRENLE